MGFYTLSLESHALDRSAILPMKNNWEKVVHVACDSQNASTKSTANPPNDDATLKYNRIILPHVGPRLSARRMSEGDMLSY